MPGPRDVVRTWVGAFNRADPDALAALYAEDATNHQVVQAPVTGRAAIREMFARAFAEAEMTCIVSQLFEDGDWAILEWRDPGGLWGCGLFHVVGGQIRFQRGYFDRLAFLRQHGLPVPDEGRPEALLVRPAAPGDAERVTHVYVDSWNLGFGARMPVIEADAARVARWRRDLAAPPPTRFWVAERGGAIVGFAGIGPSRDPVDPALGELDTIAVDPAAWRTGVGRALMAVALRALGADGYRAAILWTLERYPRGAGFYESTGWRRSGATRREGTQARYDHPLSGLPSG